MNLPNKITISRIAVVPLFLLLAVPLPQNFVNALHITAFNQFIIDYGRILSALIFILASSTDRIDGYLARKNNQITKLGIFMDPIADKLLVIAGLISLVSMNEISVWIAVIIIAREFLVTGLRIVAVGEGVVISAGSWGKLKTVTQMIAISAKLLNNWPLTLIPFLKDFDFAAYMMYVALGITIYSGFDYFRRNRSVLSSNK